MPRQRIKGRERTPTASSKLLRSVEMVNKKLNQLERAGLYGKYAYKKLYRSIQNEPKIKYNRGKKSKITVQVKQMNSSQIRYYTKIFDTFLKSKTSSPIGIRETQSKTAEKLKQSLSEITDSDIDDEDIEDFYSLVQDEDFRYLADKIGDSDIYILVNEARERNLKETGFAKLLEQYMTLNTQEIRDAALNLYNKFVEI